MTRGDESAGTLEFYVARRVFSDVCGPRLG
jgi:hypothetical protein